MYATAGAVKALGPVQLCVWLTTQTMGPENGFFLLSHQHLSLESITLKTFPQPFPLGVAGITVDVPLLSVCPPLSHESSS